MAAPYDSWWDNLNYFIECRRKKRTDRLKKVLEESGGHCKFWYITKDMETQYKDLKNSSDSILKAKLKYAVHIYHTFENNFGFREHDEWCVYDNNQNLLEGEICTNIKEEGIMYLVKAVSKAEHLATHLYYIHKNKYE